MDEAYAAAVADQADGVQRIELLRKLHRGKLRGIGRPRPAGHNDGGQHRGQPVALRDQRDAGGANTWGQVREIKRIKARVLSAGLNVMTVALMIVRLCVLIQIISGLLFLIVAGLSAGRPSQAAPQALVNVKLSGPLSPGGQVHDRMFAVSA